MWRGWLLLVVVVCVRGCVHVYGGYMPMVVVHGVGSEGVEITRREREAPGAAAQARAHTAAGRGDGTHFAVHTLWIAIVERGVVPHETCDCEQPRTFQMTQPPPK